MARIARTATTLTTVDPATDDQRPLSMATSKISDAQLDAIKLLLGDLRHHHGKLAARVQRRLARRAVAVYRRAPKSKTDAVNRLVVKAPPERVHSKTPFAKMLLSSVVPLVIVAGTQPGPFACEDA